MNIAAEAEDLAEFYWICHELDALLTSARFGKTREMMEQVHELSARGRYLAERLGMVPHR